MWPLLFFKNPIDRKKITPSLFDQENTEFIQIFFYCILVDRWIPPGQLASWWCTCCWLASRLPPQWWRMALHLFQTYKQFCHHQGGRRRWHPWTNQSDECILGAWCGPRKLESWSNGCEGSSSTGRFHRYLMIFHLDLFLFNFGLGLY